jgi:TATA-binding protein-associated factor Taf7
MSGLAASSPAHKAPRDSKRRATHSQIERRRREKINDCLLTLCSLVPACVAEVEARREAERQEAAAAAQPSSAAGGAGKRKRSRRKEKKEQPTTAEEGAKEEELGLHKLEVLTHAIGEGQFCRLGLRERE